MMAQAVAIVAQVALVLFLSPLITGFSRTMKARLQTRRGAGIWQPYRDLGKLLRKGMVIPDTASWIFAATPYVLFTTTLLAGLLIPTISAQAPLSAFGGVLAVVYLLALGRFFLALGGLDTGSSFGGLGSSREMTISAIAEPALMLAVFTVAIGAGSTNLSTVAQAALGQSWRFLAPSQMLAFAALFIVLIAETGRIPVDNPATHLELTMVHEAMVLEYSGRHLAMIEFGAFLKLLLYISLIACVFCPWKIALFGTGPLAYAVGAGAYVVKLAVAGFLLALFETATAKMRVFRIPQFLGAALMLGLLGTLLLFVSRSF